jgi:DNA-binding IclR family transcriptional regulator
MDEFDSKLFGSARRGELLILIALLGETYPTEIARLLEAPLYSVQRVVDALDRDGIVATRMSGGTRRVSLDPRYFAHRELKSLLLRLSEAQPALVEAATRRRSRLRRAGKPR